MTPRDLPIGVLGSGLGGLSVVRALRRILPFETFLYLGDTAQGSYGNKAPETIARLTLRAGTALARHQPKLLVIASGTASAHGLAALQAAAPCPVLGVIEPGAQAAAAAGGAVGIIGTAATIQSGAFEAAILRRNPEARLHALACPLLADLAEEGWTDDPITDAICRRYLNQIPFEAHTVLLGCSAHAMLLPSLARVRPDTRWLDCGELTALAAEDMLRSGLGFRTASAQGHLRILLTEASGRIKDSGARFLGEPLEGVERAEL
jgi:glutamate racemase